MEYIKSPINYIGNKYRILDELISLFPKDIHTFVDVFSGSGNVLINTMADKYIYNDLNYFISEIFKNLVFQPYDKILELIYSIINEYDLSLTNDVGFYRLREDYNNGKNDWYVLFTMMCYSYNQQFRVNNEMKYNSSFGRNTKMFRDVQKENLGRMKEFLSVREVEVWSKNYIDIDYSLFTSEDFLYFDPPYLNSYGNYNASKCGFEGWSEKNEQELLELLDKLTEMGLKWGLSNNLKYENKYLREWMTKYNVHYIQKKYLRNSYNQKNKEESAELFVCNY